MCELSLVKAGMVGTKLDLTMLEVELCAVQELVAQESVKCNLARYMTNSYTLQSVLKW